MTPRIFQKYVTAYEEKLKEGDWMNWVLGSYISMAFNNPKKYPKQALLSKENNAKIEMSDIEIENQIKLMNSKLGGTVK